MSPGSLESVYFGGSDVLNVSAIITQWTQQEAYTPSPKRTACFSFILDTDTMHYSFCFNIVEVAVNVWQS